MNESVLQLFAGWRLEELLVRYPGLRLRPATRGYVRLTGCIGFTVEGANAERITDEYEIEIVIPKAFPKATPSVREVGGRVPSSFHRLNDGSLCLGSPTRLRLLILDSPSIVSFVEQAVIPYLYGYSYFEKHRILPFGELLHGTAGIRQDLASMFGVDRKDLVHKFIQLASQKRRPSNKQPCPCGSRLRLGRCHHRQVNYLRDRLGRKWFRSVLASLPEEQ